MPPQRNEDVDVGAAVPASTLRRTSSESSMSAAEDGPITTYRDYKVRKSSLIGMINWSHVLGTYLPVLFLIGLGIFFAQIVHQVVNDLSYSIGHRATIFDILNALTELFSKLFERALHLSHNETLLSTPVKTTALVLFVMGWLLRMDNPVYLLSFATFHAPESWKVSHEQIIEMMRRQNAYTEDSIDFMRRLLVRSGTGQNTAWPPGIVQCLDGKETDRTIEGSRKEAEIVIFDIVEKALKKANVKPREIDVLVINCSLFSPTPSLCAMVVSKFGMRGDVQTFNLSGMGCGASLISVGLAKDMLQRRSGKALVVSTEIITPNLYYGNERGFLLQNTLFRCGGAAIVLSNKWWDGRRAWYKLLHTVRVQGTGEDAYQCVYETQDEDGYRGVRLSKDIVKVAGKCMEKNMTTLGPYVLPLSEQIKVVFSLASRFFFKTLRRTLSEKVAVKLPHPKVFVPDFKRGIDHFCIHAGGRAVIDGIEKNMKLEQFHTEPSRMTLLNHGNTSSSSIWYELEYIQEQQKTNPLKKGHRVMQVAFGSGFKCTSGVWLKL
uniref:3-ketoacyl-CoA synthase n=1 Tax=Helicotheca tamesis TaxID=374047 RepID=A0A7S2I4J3_9STRA|mmetsp:Transcript_5383/g.7392  ORF Transcript_5383/g.7392 Transcript_5383/m.7392 type:complete len:549 (+) Transcript_5383:180-1826(+)|eukprot:CAMPEP_0185728446 /NCGR_PEP_ID=MMETSP1171-20130828/3771_1 /TAXON_ID=374046 /ORGANISM="Helicotheca tamensis, Strain CCMP826" /LENGTH=548 /DNA_ID=CAMNT_0028397161 /DNA_START=146 /DNA_END=1792 /DNA_ORIENTATION=-